MEQAQMDTYKEIKDRYITKQFFPPKLSTAISISRQEIYRELNLHAV